MMDKVVVAVDSTTSSIQIERVAVSLDVEVILNIAEEISALRISATRSKDNEECHTI